MQERTDLEECIHRLLRTDDGKYLITELRKRYVEVDIVQLDGEVASAIREGKSQLVRYLDKVYKSQL